MSMATFISVTFIYSISRSNETWRMPPHPPPPLPKGTLWGPLTHCSQMLDLSQAYDLDLSALTYFMLSDQILEFLRHLHQVLEFSYTLEPYPCVFTYSWPVHDTLVFLYSWWFLSTNCFQTAQTNGSAAFSHQSASKPASCFDYPPVLWTRLRLGFRNPLWVPPWRRRTMKA